MSLSLRVLCKTSFLCLVSSHVTIFLGDIILSLSSGAVLTERFMPTKSLFSLAPDPTIPLSIHLVYPEVSHRHIQRSKLTLSSSPPVDPALPPLPLPMWADGTTTPLLAEVRNIGTILTLSLPITTPHMQSTPSAVSITQICPPLLRCYLLSPSHNRLSGPCRASQGYSRLRFLPLSHRSSQQSHEL